MNRNLLKRDDSFKYVHTENESGYKNPLSSELDTPDPCIVYNENDGYYYGIHTGHTKLTMHRARCLRDMFSASESSVIYEPRDEDGTYGFFWAPEIHIINGVWYIYTSTHEKDTKGHKHVIVLKAKSEQPLDGFELFGHINPELLAIDPTIYQDKKHGKLYLCSSAVIGRKQKLIIQQLSDPATPVGEWQVIAEPVYDWEMLYPYDDTWGQINEGAYFIESKDRLFIVYSGNGCWSDDYVMGILEFVGDDILSPDSWKKYEKPFMTKGNGNFGPGHATFFKSPDGSELWICHHCLHESNPEFVQMHRHCHVQKVFFDESGFPHADMPLPGNKYFEEPSGTK